MDVAEATSEVDGYDAYQCTHKAEDGVTLSYRVLVAGDGPPVIVLHELAGAGAAYLGFAAKLRRARYRTWLPIFFEPAGRDVGTIGGAVRICIRRELRSLLVGRPTALTSWLRALVAHVTSTPGRNPATGQAAVIGMCMTGGLVFNVLIDPRVAAAVAAQPSLPAVRHLPADASPPSDDATPLLLLRFARDRICRRPRIDTALATYGTEPRDRTTRPPLTIEQFGSVTAVEAPGGRHSTLTYDAGAVGCTTVDEVLSFLQRHLGSSSSTPP